MNNGDISNAEFERQKIFSEKIKKLNEGKNKKALIETFGCQMNARDSEKIRGMLSEMGYAETDDETKADFIIYNTCCVRENAENKVYGKLGYLKHLKENGQNLKVALCGCMMQQQTVIDTIKRKHKHVDIIFGTFNLYKLPELLYANMQTGRSSVDIQKEYNETAENLPSIRKYKFKAGVNIMYGCNNFCSYCIVPYVRGRERSRNSADIIDEIKKLAADGVKEVMLLGQNVNSYGRGLEENITFAQLLRKVNDIEGIKRIRFMTSHPKDLSDELIYAVRDCDKVCKFLHLPFQSGNNDILKKMNRNYTKEKYLSLIEKARKEIPRIAFSTDILVGFPGEGEKEIEDTLDIIRKVRFSSAYTFIYSKRTGTPAAEMENQTSEETIKKNFNRVLNELNKITDEINSKKENTVIEVLAEEISSDESLITGRSEDNVLVHFKADKSIIGEFVKVRITKAKTFYLLGELI